MLPGVVTAASYSTNGGYYVTINHGICVCSYLHLSKILVRTGQRVTAGYIIAISGNSGKRTTGPHLHISCRWKNERGKFFNPMLILRFVTEQLLNKEWTYGTDIDNHCSVACHCKTRQNEETPQTNVVGQIRLGENLWWWRKVLWLVIMRQNTLLVYFKAIFLAHFLQGRIKTSIFAVRYLAL